MSAFFKKILKASATTQFIFYAVLCLFILFGGFWTHLGVVVIILSHRFGKIFV